jgi:aryl-alcohol dehydrogenase-like predicted oxidoreductase
LGGGFLTGKYRRGKPRPEGARRSEPAGQFLQFDEDKGFDIVDELEKIANSHNATVAQAALNYLLRKPGVTSVIIGARNKEQLADNLKAADWEMSPEEVRHLDELSKPARVYPYWAIESTSRDR